MRAAEILSAYPDLDVEEVREAHRSELRPSASGNFRSLVVLEVPG
jgi:hypothetical protein